MYIELQITSHKEKIFCINDSKTDIDFQLYKDKLIDCFERVYPNKSSFEI